MSMGHVLPRFRHKHGMILSRSVAADRPLESYCIGHDLAAMAAPRCSVMRRSGVYRAGPVGGAGPGQYAVRYQKRPEGLAAPHSTAATECVASGLHWMAGRMIWGRMMWRIRNREGSKWGGEIRRSWCWCWSAIPHFVSGSARRPGTTEFRERFWVSQPLALGNGFIEVMRCSEHLLCSGCIIPVFGSRHRCFPRTFPTADRSDGKDHGEIHCKRSYR